MVILLLLTNVHDNKRFMWTCQDLYNPDFLKARVKTPVIFHSLEAITHIHTDCCCALRDSKVSTEIEVSALSWAMGFLRVSGLLYSPGK